MSIPQLHSRFRVPSFLSSFPSSPSLPCAECRKAFPKKDLWVCLSCASGTELRCGRGADSACAIEHAKDTKHGLVMNVLSRMIWCYFCDTEVLDEYGGNRAGTLPQKVRHCLDPQDPTTDPEEEQHTKPGRPRRRPSSDVGAGGGAADDGSESGEDEEETMTWVEYYHNGKGGEVGMSNLGNTCFPEHDTRVLTNSGFLFLSDIEERIDAGEAVLYACYDERAQSIVYKPGQLVHAATPARWVDFTQSATRRHWDATSSDDYGSSVAARGVYASYLTLRTTPEHDMYFQPCTGFGAAGDSSLPTVIGGAPILPHKMPARQLAPGYQCSCVAAGATCTHGYSHYRMYTGAANGLQPPADVISVDNLANDDDSPVAALGLRDQGQLDAFLELFGYWLGAGSIVYHTRAGPSGGGVLFSPSKDHDRVYLRGLLARLHLRRGQHFTSNEKGTRLEVQVTVPAWFKFFDEEFGVKHKDSRHYNKRRALLKQGMHSSQRRPLRPSTASTYAAASATATLAVASSSRALSVSASASPPSTTRSLRSASVSHSVSVSAELSLAQSPGQDDGDDPDDDGGGHGSDDGGGGDSDGASVVLSDVDWESVDDDEHDPLKSAKWMPHWVMHRLDKRQLRLVIEGLRQADGRSAASTAQRESAAAGDGAMQGLHQICTSGLGFRDQLIQACLHAGFSAYFRVNTRADEVRGYNAVPSDGRIHSKEEVEASRRVDPSRDFQPVRAKHDDWWVCYCELVSELLPAEDIRFDGSACSIRQKAARKQGFVAVHDDGTEQQAATQRELAGLLACSSSAVAQALSHGYKVARVWRILTAAQHEEQRSGCPPQQAAAIATQTGDLYNRERDGRVWCVDVQHKDHLIFVQRVQRNAEGVVTKVGRTMITGNCFMSSALQALAHTPPLIAFLSEMSHIPLDSIRHRLIADFSVLLQKVWSGHYSLVAPGDLLRDIIFINPFFRGYGQHDAQELIRCLIDQMHEGLKRSEEYEYTRYVYGEGTGEEQEVHWRERELLKERDKLMDRVRERRGKKGDKDRKRRDRDNHTAAAVTNGHSGRHPTAPSATSASPSPPSSVITRTEQKDPAPSITSTSTTSSPSLSSSSSSSSSSAPSSSSSSSPGPPPAPSSSPDGRRPIKQWPEHSIISDIFSGYLQSRIRCHQCQSISTVYDQFYDLSLEIPKDSNMKRIAQERGSEAMTPAGKQGWFGSLLTYTGLMPAPLSLETSVFTAQPA